MFTRRNFLKTAAAGGQAVALAPVRIIGAQQKKTAEYFGVHDFVENHPEAVFIMRTKVDEKTNHDAVKKAGNTFASSVLVPKKNGVSLSSLINIIPNLTNIRKDAEPKGDMVYRMGIVTDPWFIEGVIERFKSLGAPADHIHVTETWNLGNWEPIGYTSMAQRTGVHMNDTLEKTVEELNSDQIQWIDVPDGVWFRKIPYIWPVNAPGSWLLNIAKFKAHGMCLTLCCKNIQGNICHDYQLFCSGPKGAEEHFNPRRESVSEEHYKRDVADGIPRWDSPKGGLRMAKWVERTLDNISVTPLGLNVIEGVYGRDGDGFLHGPYPEGNDNNPEGQARDHMTNIIIFGKDPFRVDSIGHWLGGHEPGNVGLFHLALKRGMSTVLNPRDIPVYEWRDGKATPRPLDTFERTPLKTRYIVRDYNGQNEPYYHLCNEPFDYSSVKIIKSEAPVQPGIRILNRKYACDSGQDMEFDYGIPQDGYARIEIVNPLSGDSEVLTDSFHLGGHHMAVWNSKGIDPGMYYIRLRYKDFDSVLTVSI